MTDDKYKGGGGGGLPWGTHTEEGWGGGGSGSLPTSSEAVDEMLRRLKEKDAEIEKLKAEIKWLHKELKQASGI